MTIDPHEDWTEAERWAWKQIQAGAVADFNGKLGEVADPAKPEDWDERRTLRRRFLEAIIEPPWREHVHRKGIGIMGGLLPKEDELSLDWHRADMPWDVWLERSRVTGPIEMSYAKLGGILSLDGSRFEAALNLERLEVGQDLFLGDKAHFGGDVTLTGAKVGGQLVAAGSRFEATVDMQGLEVEQDLFLSEKAHFSGDVTLRSAELGGMLSLDGSRFEAQVIMERLKVRQDLFLSNEAYFGGDVTLRSAKVGGHLSAIGSRFEAEVEMQGLEVGQNLFLRDKAHFGGPIDLVHAKIGGGLQLCGSTWLALVDMTGAEVIGELHLASSDWPVPRWGERAGLILCNARLGALQDAHGDGMDAWPKTLDLSGCRIEILGGYRGDDDASDVLARPASYWVDWLARGTKERFSPQPYQMIARLLQEAGYPAKANSVLYAARKRERDAPRGALHRIWLWVLWATIGFGIGRYLRPRRAVGLWGWRWLGPLSSISRPRRRCQRIIRSGSSRRAWIG